MFYAFVTRFIQAMLGLLTRLEVRGLENLPQQGPALIVANHTHFLDPPIIGAVLPRHVRFMAKTELFRVPVLGWMVKHYEAFPVRRGEADRQAFKVAVDILRQGGVLVMFPEGTRSKTGALQPGHQGVAVIAMHSGAPVVPVGISGSHLILQWPAILRRPRLVVSVGVPFYITPPSGPADRRRALVESTEEMMLRLAALLPEKQRGVYAASARD